MYSADVGCLLLFTVRRWVEICLVGDIVVNTIKLFIVNVELFTVLADPSDLTLQKRKDPSNDTSDFIYLLFVRTWILLDTQSLQKRYKKSGLTIAILILTSNNTVYLSLTMAKPGDLLLCLLVVLLTITAVSGTPTAPVVVPLSTISTSRGDHSTDQGLDALLTVQEQDGSQNDWDAYVEFSAGRRGYVGLFDYTVPSNDVVRADAVSLAVDVNFLGASFDEAVWTWKIRNFDTGTWIFLGDNNGSDGWSAWYQTRFVVAGDNVSSFVSQSGLIRLRLQTSQKWEVCDLDVQKVTVALKSDPTTTTTTTTPAATDTTTATTTASTATTAIPLTTTTTTTTPTTTTIPTTTSTSTTTTTTTTTPTTTTSTTTPTTTLMTSTAVPPNNGVWTPSPGTTWQWQISGNVDTSIDVDMYDIDLFDVPRTTIDQLHADGRIVICYFSAGSYEDWRPDADAFGSNLLGQPLGDWDGEW